MGTTTITEITTLTTQITTYETTEAKKSAELQNINDQIDDIIARLAILNKQLKKEEKDLLATRPADISQIQSSLNQALKAMQYPQRAPERFLENTLLPLEINLLLFKPIIEIVYLKKTKYSLAPLQT